MIPNKIRVILPALLGSILLTTLGTAPSFADDSMSVQVASSDRAQECMDTSSQKKYNEEIDSKRIVMPMDKGNYALTSPYGARISPITGATEVHTGSDFAGPDKSPIYSVAAGIVTESGPSSYGGQWVMVRHNLDGKVYDSVYIHLTEKSQMVKVGDKVTPGQIIAREGSTGLSTGPHLHLEIWEDGFNGYKRDKDSKGKHVNALEWLKSNNAKHVNEAPAYKAMDCSFGEVSKASNVAWGEHKNGEIPEAVLGSVKFKDSVKLEKVAAEKLNALNGEFKAKFNTDIPLVKGYENLESQNSGSSESLPGKSFFGWGKSIELNFTHASNPYIPLISEPDYFTDEQYVWMNENGKRFGWINPEQNQKTGKDADPDRWVYSEYEKDTNSKTVFETYAIVNSMTHTWNSAENRTCLNNLWSQDGSWNNAYDKEDQFGIAKLSSSEIASYKIDLENYKNSPNTQIATGLNYISDKYGNPCGALKVWKETGKY